jgi:hypothetical protein
VLYLPSVSGPGSTVLISSMSSDLPYLPQSLWGPLVLLQAQGLLCSEQLHIFMMLLKENVPFDPIITEVVIMRKWYFPYLGDSNRRISV